MSQTKSTREFQATEGHGIEPAERFGDHQRGALGAMQMDVQSTWSWKSDGTNSSAQGLHGERLTNGDAKKCGPHLPELGIDFDDMGGSERNYGSMSPREKYETMMREYKLKMPKKLESEGFGFREDGFREDDFRGGWGKPGFEKPHFGHNGARSYSGPDTETQTPSQSGGASADGDFHTRRRYHNPVPMEQLRDTEPLLGLDRISV